VIDRDLPGFSWMRAARMPPVVLGHTSDMYSWTPGTPGLRRAHVHHKPCIPGSDCNSWMMLVLLPCRRKAEQMPSRPGSILLNIHYCEWSTGMSLHGYTNIRQMCTLG
jgi:hypothetical protein